MNRTTTGLKAALNLAAEHDERINNRRAWETGLAILPDAEQSRNVILTETAMRQIIAAAYRQSAEFGQLIELAAVTGARVSQLALLEVRDLQVDREAPRLMTPTSRKGRGTKLVRPRPVPIPTDLAAKLRLHAATPFPSKADRTKPAAPPRTAAARPAPVNSRVIWLMRIAPWRMMKPPDPNWPISPAKAVNEE